MLSHYVCHITTLLSMSAHTKCQTQRERGLFSLCDPAGASINFTLRIVLSHSISHDVNWTHNEFVFPSRQPVQLKHDLLVQLGSIYNKDYIFQCSLCCFHCGNKEKRFLITNNLLHALLTDYFVHIVGACSGLLAPCTKNLSLLIVMKTFLLIVLLGESFWCKVACPMREMKNWKRSSLLIL